jgi:hypothetical protein
MLTYAVTELASTRASAKDAVVQVFVSSLSLIFVSPLFRGTFVGGQQRRFGLV